MSGSGWQPSRSFRLVFSWFSLFFSAVLASSVRSAPGGFEGVTRTIRRGAPGSRLLQRARSGLAGAQKKASLGVAKKVLRGASFAAKKNVSGSTATTVAALSGNATNISVPLPLNDTALIIGDMGAEVTEIEASLQRMSAALNATAARVEGVKSWSNGTVAELTSMNNETSFGIGEAQTNNQTIQAQLLLVPVVNQSLNKTDHRYLKMNSSLVKIRADLNASSKMVSAQKRVDSAMDVLKLLAPRFKRAVSRVNQLNDTTFDGNFTLTLRAEVDEVVQNIMEDANIAQSRHIHEDAEEE